ncbi:hypothetical protein FRX31_017074 [Thalictrum thalictroides]|uniref:NAC domain-containing protein n=1 Tax=Thalictrum thalictroides TaxID=46969 RepID=A0A7J6W9S3_THATH|nr:hypothetical protein FRX31_017074 [Thalictrum thalictroides]
MGKGLGEHQYYFVVPKPRVCKAGNGRWIANTKHKPILDEQEDDIIGYKRTLTYYIFPKERQSSKDDIKTKWIMHEYRLQQTAKTQWALCKIGENGTTGSSCPSAEAGYDDHSL